MDKEVYSLAFLFLIFNFAMGIMNTNHGSYYRTAVSFTAVGLISGMIIASILNDYYGKVSQKHSIEIENMKERIRLIQSK